MRYDILGVTFDHVSLAQAVSRAGAMLDGDVPHAVVTPNAEIVWLAGRDPGMRAALNAADLVLPDGVGVVKAAHMLGYPIRERVAGIDFAQALLPVLAERNAPLYLLGGRPGIAESAAQRLAAAHPGLTVCGARDGYYAPGAEANVAADIRQTGARAVFVCLGAPKQEQFIWTQGAATGARLLVGLGGALDVWAGAVKRAPALFITLGLEWLYRILRQPRRLIRALRLPAFLWAVRRQRMQDKRQRSRY